MENKNLTPDEQSEQNLNSDRDKKPFMSEEQLANPSNSILSNESQLEQNNDTKNVNNNAYLSSNKTGVNSDDTVENTDKRNYKLELEKIIQSYNKQDFITPVMKDEALKKINKNSNMENAVSAYNKVKIEINHLIFNNKELELNKLITRNGRMLNELTKLNEILTIILDNQKHFKLAKRIIKKNKEFDNEKQEKINLITQETNKKIINTYLNDCKRVDDRIQKIGSVEYILQLKNNLNKINEEILMINKENKKLHKEQKLDEKALQKFEIVPLERQLKDKLLICEKINNDYNKLLKKLDNNILNFKKNEDKLDKLNDKQTKLENTAKENGIDNLIDIKKIQDNIDDQISVINRLKEKIKIVDHSGQVYNDKLKKQFEKNYDFINNLEEKKNNLSNEIVVKGKELADSNIDIINLQDKNSKLRKQFNSYAKNNLTNNLSCVQIDCFNSFGTN